MEGENNTVPTTTTPVSTSKGNNMKLIVGMVVVLALLAAIIGGAFIVTQNNKDKNDDDTVDSDRDDDSDTEDNSGTTITLDEVDEDTLEEAGDIAEAMKKQKGIKMEFSNGSETGTVTYDSESGDIAIESSSGSVYIVDDYYYVGSGDSWYKMAYTEDESTDYANFDDFMTAESFVGSYPDMRKVGEEDCLGSKNDCDKYEFNDEISDTGIGILRIDQKTHLIDSTETTYSGQTSVYTFSYGSFEVNLPDEAKDAQDYEELLNSYEGGMDSL